MVKFTPWAASAQARQFGVSFPASGSSYWLRILGRLLIRWRATRIRWFVGLGVCDDMRAYSWKSATAAKAIILGVAIFLSAAPTPPRPQAVAPTPREVALSLDPAQTKVHFNVDSTLHMVHGTLALKSGALQFDPQTGKSSGLIVVDAVRCDTSNSSRDQRLHKEILENWKFADATFRPSQIDGKVSLTAPSDFKLKGIITLHGTDHGLVAEVHSA